MKKTLIALSAILAIAAYAGDNVGGNCGNGSGSGSACLPSPVPIPTTINNHVVNQSTNVNTNASSSRASSNSVSVSRSSANSSSNSSVGNVAPVQTNAGNNSSNSAWNSGNNSANSATNAGNNSSLTQNYQAQDRNPVSTAYAAPLTATNGTCMGSSTGGLSFPNFGISGGSTWNDEQCNRRYNAIMLTSLGQNKSAIALMCQDANVQSAMIAAGSICPEQPKAVVARPDITDPFIRRRLGLAN